MLSYQLEFRGLDEQLAKMDGYSAMAMRHLGRAMLAGVLTLEGEWKQASPVGATGRYRQSITSRVSSLGSDVVGRVTAGVAIYPGVQEFGRRPGTAPPPGALDSWVRRVMGVSEEEAPRVAFLVGRKLKRRGMAGRGYARKAFESAKSKIEGFFVRALQRIAEGLVVRA